MAIKDRLVKFETASLRVLILGLFILCTILLTPAELTRLASDAVVLR